MLSINYAKVPPFSSFVPLFIRDVSSPRPFSLLSCTPRRSKGREKWRETITPRSFFPSWWPILAHARPVTSLLPLCTVISQSRRRVATIQPLTRDYIYEPMISTVSQRSTVPELACVSYVSLSRVYERECARACVHECAWVCDRVSCVQIAKRQEHDTMAPL